MPQKKHTIATDDRRKTGHSVPLRDTSDGNTGVPADPQGISNRPGNEDDTWLDPDQSCVEASWDYEGPD